MTLPFPEKDNSRKYTCFCCGYTFKEFQEFKDHIIEKHEVGKDYILCPLIRCAAPIRDLRSHFKAIHPHEQLPKAGMMRSMVWRDFSPKKKKNGKKFKDGWYPSTKMGKKIHFRSSYEETVYKCLDALPEVVAFEAEPFKVPYLHEGKSHEYTPDLLVSFVNGNKEIWEIKPADQMTLEVNQNKWACAKIVCQNRGWGFEVINEQRINQLKKQVRRVNG